MHEAGLIHAHYLAEFQTIVRKQIPEGLRETESRSLQREPRVRQGKQVRILTSLKISQRGGQAERPRPTQKGAVYPFHSWSSRHVVDAIL